MVEISEAASKVLLKNLVDSATTSDVGYRLTETETGYKLRLDRPGDSDRVVHKEGHVVLMVEPGVDEALDDVVLDLKEGDETMLTLQAH